MSAYLTPIITAIVIFPILAALAVVPYALHQYRRFGSISKLKLLIFFSFCFYLLCAYFLVILPLPDRAAVAKLTTARYNLVPFTAARYFFKTTVLRLTVPATYVVALKQSGFIQPFFNLMLTLPFGLYLRYIWHVSFKKALIASFCLSLFFELTQLSGLYFIYPRSYRLFDVDDLILNTSGGLIGFAIEPVFAKIFPSIEQLNQDAASERLVASFWRRFLALLIDLFIFNLVSDMITTRSHQLSNQNYGIYLVEVLIYFVAIPYFWQGGTLGKHLVKIRMVGVDEQRLGLLPLLFRQFLLFGVMLGNVRFLIPSLLQWISDAKSQHVLAFYFTGLAICGAFLLLCALNTLVLLLKKNSRMFYERVTKSHEIGY